MSNQATPVRERRMGGRMAVSGKSVPKYGQIANTILSRIESGLWKPGDRLPAETELARSMGVSVGTVQKALQRLADQGVVIRRHGRGTFVGGGRAPADDLRHFRFLSESGDRLLPVYSRVLSIERVSEQGGWARFLGPDEGYVQLRRLLNIDGEFEVFTEIYLSGARFAGLLELDPRDLDGVLIRDFLADRFNTPTLRVEQRLTCGVLPPRVCNLIHVARGSMGLIWLLLGFTYRDAPAIYQRAYVPPTDRPLQMLDRTTWAAAARKS